MRVRNSLINISAGIGSQIVITLLSFVSRTLFIQFLGAAYLGVNGLFGNILGVLSLAEAGIGSAIIYNLYKPVAENDVNRINTLMKFYKKAYLFIGAIVFILGMILMPFLPYIVKDATIDHLYLIYFIFVLNTTATYLFAYKVSFLNVAQKSYIATTVYTISSIIAIIIKLAILYFTHNYILYLAFDIVVTIVPSYILTRIVDKKYPFLRDKKVEKLDGETKDNIKKNVKALLLHNIGGYAVFGTDNILIASFISIKAVGLYSNYYMIINIFRTFMGQIFDNVNHSVGNLVAKESNEKVYSVFRVMLFFNFWLYSSVAIFLFVVMKPLIIVWIGSEYVMGMGVLFILVVNLYVSGMRRSITMVKTTSGIFHEDRYAPFIEAIVNLVAAIVFIQYFGIAGVFLGTLVSTLLVPFWIAPYLVYKKVFQLPVMRYFYQYAVYVIVAGGVGMLTVQMATYAPSSGWLHLVFVSTIALVLPSFVYFLLFHRTEECKYLVTIVKSIFWFLTRKVKLSSKKTTHV